LDYFLGIQKGEYIYLAAHRVLSKTEKGLLSASDEPICNGGSKLKCGSLGTLAVRDANKTLSLSPLHSLLACRLISLA